MQSLPTVEQAVTALAGVCDGAKADDGQGFNGRDAEFGHSLAASIRNYGRLTSKQKAAGYKMVRTYRGQLAGMGIDYDAIPDPTSAPKAAVEVHADFADIRNDPEVPATVPQHAVASLSARQVLGNGGVIAQHLAGYEAREGQLALAEAIEASVAANTNLVSEAGTGTGKSLAYLVPAILSGKRTLVSTADKALQSQIINKDIPFLQSVMPRPFTAALLKGRGNYLCLQHLDKAKEEVLQEGFRSEAAITAWPQLLEWAATTTDGDLDTAMFNVPVDVKLLVTADSDTCIGSRCPFVGECFAERAKLAAKRADVVVVNHALLMRDLEVKYATDGQASIIPDVQVYVIDECHRIEDIATDAFAIELTPTRMRRLVGRIERFTSRHHSVADADRETAGRWANRAADVATEYDAFFNVIESRMRHGRVTTAKLGDERTHAAALLAQLEGLAKAMESGTPSWLEDIAERIMWGKLAVQVGKLHNEVATAADPEYATNVVRFSRIDGQGTFQRLVLVVKAIEVADQLRSRLWNNADEAAVICTSATVVSDRGFDTWRERVGCDAATEIVAQSPFNYRLQSVLYLPEDGASLDPSKYRFDGSIEYFDRLANEIEQLLLASDGRAFCLFTSFKVLEEVHSRLAPRLSWLILRQGDMPRPQLIERFRADGHAVLFGVKSFWEGVDVQGEALSLVVIDKLPFSPPDDPVWEARCAAINEKRHDQWASFNELAIPTTVIALKQGVGRLIRSTTDRGVCAILDGRLTTKRYGPAVVRALPPMATTRSMDAVRLFYGN